jgi:serine/threonine-protein kinase PknG
LLGLLYCDFKPANIIQVGDGQTDRSRRVRRIDDDQSPIYGTIGFQATGGCHEGTSIASDLYTVARTLATLISSSGIPEQCLTSLPSPTDVPIFAQHDSLYRWLVKALLRNRRTVSKRPTRCATSCSVCCAVTAGVGGER